MPLTTVAAFGERNVSWFLLTLPFLLPLQAYPTQFGHEPVEFLKVGSWVPFSPYSRFYPWGISPILTASLPGNPVVSQIDIFSSDFSLILY